MIDLAKDEGEMVFDVGGCNSSNTIVRFQCDSRRLTVQRCASPDTIQGTLPRGPPSIGPSARSLPATNAAKDREGRVSLRRAGDDSLDLLRYFERRRIRQ